MVFSRDFDQIGIGSRRRRQLVEHEDITTIQCRSSIRVSSNHQSTADRIVFACVHLDSVSCIGFNTNVCVAIGRRYHIGTICIHVDNAFVIVVFGNGVNTLIRNSHSCNDSFGIISFSGSVDNTGRAVGDQFCAASQNDCRFRRSLQVSRVVEVAELNDIGFCILSCVNFGVACAGDNKVAVRIHDISRAIELNNRAAVQAGDAGNSRVTFAVRNDNSHAVFVFADSDNTVAVNRNRVNNLDSTRYQTRAAVCAFSININRKYAVSCSGVDIAVNRVSRFADRIELNSCVKCHRQAVAVRECAGRVDNKAVSSFAHECVETGLAVDHQSCNDSIRIISRGRAVNDGNIFAKEFGAVTQEQAFAFSNLQISRSIRQFDDISGFVFQGVNRNISRVVYIRLNDRAVSIHCVGVAVISDNRALVQIGDRCNVAFAVDGNNYAIACNGNCCVVRRRNLVVNSDCAFFNDGSICSVSNNRRVRNNMVIDVVDTVEFFSVVVLVVKEERACAGDCQRAVIVACEGSKNDCVVTALNESESVTFNTRRGVNHAVNGVILRLRAKFDSNIFARARAGDDNIRIFVRLKCNCLDRIVISGECNINVSFAFARSVYHESLNFSFGVSRNDLQIHARRDRQAACRRDLGNVTNQRRVGYNIRSTGFDNLQQVCIVSLNCNARSQIGNVGRTADIFRGSQANCRTVGTVDDSNRGFGRRSNRRFEDNGFTLGNPAHSSRNHGRAGFSNTVYQAGVSGDIVAVQCTVIKFDVVSTLTQSHCACAVLRADNSCAFAGEGIYAACVSAAAKVNAINP